MKLRKLLLLALLPICARAADLGIEFTGFMVMSDKTQVALTIAATGSTSWVTVGQKFSGYVVSAFEPADEVVVLVKDGITTRLRLKASKVGVKTVSPEQEQIIRKAVLNNLRMIGAAADQFYLENGKSQTTLAELVGPDPTKYIKELRNVDGEDYGTLVLRQGVNLSVTTASGVTVSYAQ
jgi:hypothetical protein